MKPYTKRKGYKVKTLFNLLFIILLRVIEGKIFLRSDLIISSFSSITHHFANEDHGWNLFLVNRDNYIPDDYEVELTELSIRCNSRYQKVSQDIKIPQSAHKQRLSGVVSTIQTRQPLTNFVYEINSIFLYFIIKSFIVCIFLLHLYIKSYLLNLFNKKHFHRLSITWNIKY